MLLAEDIRRIVGDTSFPGYEFAVEVQGPGAYILRARFMAPCAVRGGDPVWQHTRPWLLEYPSTEGAVVGTLLKMILTSIEHEAREAFLWKGKRVFDPHVDITKLAALSGD